MLHQMFLSLILSQKQRFKSEQYELLTLSKKQNAQPNKTIKNSLILNFTLSFFSYILLRKKPKLQEFDIK